MKPADTSDEAYQRQLEVWRAKSVGERLKAVLDMSDFVRECAKARIRKQHPEMSELEVMHQLIYELHGVRVGDKLKE